MLNLNFLAFIIPEIKALIGTRLLILIYNIQFVKKLFTHREIS